MFFYLEKINEIIRKTTQTFIILHFTWIALFLSWSGTTSGLTFFRALAKKSYIHNEKDGIPFIIFTIPLIITSILSVISLCFDKILFLQKRKNYNERNYHLDDSSGIISKYLSSLQNKLLNVKYWMIIISASLILFTISKLYRSNMTKASPWNNDASLSHIGNTFGIVSVYTISNIFFIIPISSRHGSIISYILRWNSIECIQNLHVYFGWIFILSGVIHGLIHMLRRIIFNNDNDVNSYECMKDVISINSNLTLTTDCYREIQFVTGISSIIFILILSMTSVNYVRRKYYRIFYICHLIFGPSSLLILLVHWNRMVLYLLPTFIYYIASKVLYFSTTKYDDDDGNSSTSNDNSTLDSSASNQYNIVYANAIPSSGGCMDICIEMNTNAGCNSITRMSLYEEAIPLYCKISLPTIYSKILYHPFTIIPHDGSDDNNNKFHIIFRSVGPFTKALYKNMNYFLHDNSNKNNLLTIDGFFGDNNCKNYNTILHKHNTIVLIAGGIGITPFISMITSCITILSKRDEQNTAEKKKMHMHLHWTCRDHGLVDYIISKFLGSMQNDKSYSDYLSLKIFIYHTIKNNSNDNGTKKTKTLSHNADITMKNGDTKDEKRFLSCTKSYHQSNNSLDTATSSVSSSSNTMPTMISSSSSLSLFTNENFDDNNNSIIDRNNNNYKDNDSCIIKFGDIENNYCTELKYNETSCLINSDTNTEDNDHYNHNSIKHDIIICQLISSIFSFTTIIVIGTYITWKVYNTTLYQNIILFRLILPFVILGFSKIINLMINFLMMNIIINVIKKCQRVVSSDDSATRMTDDHNNEPYITMPTTRYNSINDITNRSISYNSDSMCNSNCTVQIDKDVCTTTTNATTKDNNNDSIGKRLKIQQVVEHNYYGRPNMHHLLQQYCYPNYENIGIFTCGPLPMQQEIKKYVSSYNNDVCNERGEKIILYEEYFEI